MSATREDFDVFYHEWKDLPSPRKMDDIKAMIFDAALSGFLAAIRINSLDNGRDDRIRDIALAIGDEIGGASHWG